MEIREAQRQVDLWIGRFQEGYWPPLGNLARLVEEVGELARELNHRYGEKPRKVGDKEQDIALELGDIFWVVVCLANSLDIDLDEAFSRTLEKVTTRDSGRFTPKEAGTEA